MLLCLSRRAFAQPAHPIHQHLLLPASPAFNISTLVSGFHLYVLPVLLFLCLQASFVGAVAMADLVKSTLGPKGMVSQPACLLLQQLLLRRGHTYRAHPRHRAPCFCKASLQQSSALGVRRISLLDLDVDGARQYVAAVE
jgi:hypothetical protein